MLPKKSFAMVQKPMDIDIGNIDDDCATLTGDSFCPKENPP